MIIEIAVSRLISNFIWYNFFHKYEALLDSWMFYDNSELKPRLIAEKKNQIQKIYDEIFFTRIRNTKEL